jgi:RHS repeat-associated protein
MRRLIVLMLIAALFVPIAMPVRSLALQMRAYPHEESVLASLFDSVVAAWHKLLATPQEGGDEMPESYTMPPVVAPAAPATEATIRSSIVDLDIVPGGGLDLQVGETAALMANPVDSTGNTLQGITAEWTSSDPSVAQVSDSGEVEAIALGTATMTATVGGLSATMDVTVEDTQSVAAGDPLPDNETGSLYMTSNSLGTAPGRATPGAATRAVATDGTERPGSANFTFDVPLVNLTGRKMDVALNLNYNSRLWNTSTVGGTQNGTTHLTYDVDSGWPAPGFRLGYGQLESQTTAGYTLTDPDGTRHELRLLPNSPLYESTDGTFIFYNPATHIVTYTDGTQVRYAAAGGGKRSYPTRITDRHGNFINITYVSNVGPKISTVQDTMLRVTRFYYATNGDLSRITVPTYLNQTGGDGCDPSRIVCRERTAALFIYSPLSITGAFSSTISVTRPTDPQRVIKYIYFPQTGAFSGEGSGYEYSYSTYGMIYKIRKLRQMKLNAGTTAVTSSQEAAWTEYNYHGTPLPPPSTAELTGAPFYTKRTDEWAGRTTTGDPPFYSFYVDEAQGISKITAPDGRVTETRTITDSNDPNYGLVKETLVKESENGPVLSKISTTWDPSVNDRNPRQLRIEQTNEARQTRATAFSDYDEYNNARTISQYDFGAVDGPAGTELRRTKITFERRTTYWTRRLVNLPTRVEVYDETGGANRLLSMTDYAYDTYALIGYNDIKMHDLTFNTASPAYQPATAARGNLTTVVTYPDVTNTSNQILDTIHYDVAGNALSETDSCCGLKRFFYTVAYHYAYVESETDGPASSGPQLTVNFMYDRYTGLVRKITDENGQSVTLDYWPQSLRLSRTTRADGSWSEQIYDDRIYATPAPGRANQHSMLISNIGPANSNGDNLTSYEYTDGRGDTTRTLADNNAQGYTTVDIVFDNMGRIDKISNPYLTDYNARNTQPVTPATGPWTKRTYDLLDRIKTVTMPGNTGVIKTDYDGKVTKVTDQAGRQRRQIVDGLNRIVQVHEPDATSGDLGTTSSPVQSTSYQYDALNNLVQVTQGAQHRFFKYDSLSRLTYERQVEQAAPYATTPDPLTNNSAWSSKYTYDDENLVAYDDPRQAHTQFEYDPLNRVTNITHSNEIAANTNGITTPNVTYTYGGSATSLNNGRLIKVATSAIGSTVPATEQNYTYNQMGQVIGQTQKIGSTAYSLSYTYNKMGQQLTETYPSGRIVTYEYNHGSHLTGMHDATRSYLSGITYGAYGLPESETLGNGTTESFSYNARLQLSSMSLKKANVTLQRYDYTYGTIGTSGAINEAQNAGEIAGIDGFIGTTTAPPAQQWRQRFKYDQLGRLGSAEEYVGDNGGLTYRAAYTYDIYGNRYQSGAQNVGLPSYTNVVSSDVNTQTNRFTSGTGIQYDSAGNITTDQKFKQMQYKYDSNGKQRWAKKITDNSEANYVYDGLGQRVAVQMSDVWRYMVYDINGQMIAEYGGLASGESGVQYINSDHQGSTRVVTDRAGTVAARHDYFPFGEEIQAGVGLRTSSQGYVTTDKTRQRYTGLERDEDSGLDNTLFRKYESAAGRWTSPDPYSGSMDVRDPQSYNRYAYVENDPVNRVDHTGLTYQLVCWFLPFNHESAGPLMDCAFVDIPESFGEGGGDPSRGGGGVGRRQKKKKQKKQCPPSAEDLLKNPVVQQALNDAFTASQYGDPKNAHEEGGFIMADSNGNITSATIFRVAPGNPNSSGPLENKNLNNNAVPNVPGLTLVGIFHTHPYDKGMAVTGYTGAQYADPKKASPADKDLSKKPPTGLGVPGLIAYQDKKGKRKNSKYGPKRGKCTTVSVP